MVRGEEQIVDIQKKALKLIDLKIRAYKSVYRLKIPKYRLNTDPNLKKIQTKYSLHLTKIQTLKKSMKTKHHQK